jgi:putative oxidoreductase
MTEISGGARKSQLAQEGPIPRGSISRRRALLGGAIGTYGGRLGYWAASIRIAAAVVFIAFGLDKFTSHASELASFERYALPAPEVFVYVIGVLEIVGGSLLLVGLLARPAAVALAGDMVGAIVVSGVARGENISLTLAPLLLLAMIFLLWSGAGRWSIDRRLAATHSAVRRRQVP